MLNRFPNGWSLREFLVGNVVVPGLLNSAQMASLLKQADIAVFPNRCEGGTNLVAMEAIACGIPTVLSANSGHLDLMRLGCPGVVPMPSNHPLKIPLSDMKISDFGVSLIRIIYLSVFIEFLEGRNQFKPFRGQDIMKA